MESTELLKKVRRIEIRTRRLSEHIFSGEYHTSFKGRGMSFSEVREYHYGDDIRAIDWNVTARFNHPYVKIFEEERELTVMLLVDMSASESFGTVQQMKDGLITELCAVLSFSAIQNNDKVGIIFFSDIIEKFIPPKKGKSHILRIIRELLNFKPKQKGTNLAEAFRYLTNVMKKKSIVFVLSDFKDSNYKNALSIASKKHDMIGIRVHDPREEELPAIGLIRSVDAETGQPVWLDTSRKRVREIYRQWYEESTHYFKESFLKSGADSLDIRTDESYVQKLMNFFKKRGVKR